MKLSRLYLLYMQKRISRRCFIAIRFRFMRTEERRRWEDEDEWQQEQFSLENFSRKECRTLFRYRKDDLEPLRVLLKISDSISTRERDRVSGIQALCILLRRLAYPNRWMELRRIFSRSQGALTRIFYHTLHMMDRRFRHLLSSWNQSCLTEDDFELCTSAISRKGRVVPNVFAFIDGTARPISCAKRHQRIMYSRHKRMHCIKWQAVMLPNGMLVNLHGGERDSVHDSRMFSESDLLPKLSQKMAGLGKEYRIYGDSGYGENELLARPSSSAACLTDKVKRQQNFAMSSVRQSVEWAFKEINSRFAFVDLRKQMKLLEKPVNVLYRVAVLLSNCHNCSKPNQTSKYFELEPPCLEEYLEN